MIRKLRIWYYIYIKNFRGCESVGNLKKLDLYQNAINKLRPFEDDMLKQVRDFYRVGLTWTSNALEGNSLTESETKKGKYPK